jgi:type I restriction enzyme S subunit
MAARTVAHNRDVKLIPLRDLCERITVGIASAATHAYRKEGVPMIRNTNIKEGYIEVDQLLYLDPAYEQHHRNKRLSTGDVVVVRTGNPGIAAVVPPMLNGAQCFTSLIIRPKVDVLDPDFLCTYINSPAGQRQFSVGAAGGAQKNVNAGTLSRMGVPVTPIERQREVVSIARLMITFAYHTRCMIEAKRKFKRGLLREVLGGEKRFPNFSSSPWPTQRFDHLCEELSERNGNRLGPNSVMGVIKGVGFQAMRDRVRGRGDLTRYKVVPPHAFAFNPMRLNIGSIAYNNFDHEILVSPDYEVFRARPGIAAPSFVNQLRYSAYWSSFMKRSGAGSVRIRIYFSDLARLRVPAPTVQEQSRIAEVLGLADTEIEQLRHLHELVGTQKRALLSKLLSSERQFSHERS